MLIIISILLVVLLYVDLGIKKDEKREEFGGPIKSFKRIPMNLCQKRCKGYMNWCMDKYGHNNAGGCMNDYSSCSSACKYSDFHRT